MKKLILTTIAFASLMGCADQNKRLHNLKKMYPQCKVEPATGLIQNQGYDFIVIDTAMQIIAVEFYIGSETKILRMRNIR
jgi:hypothetical protein